jgi:hypothetical protein
MHGVRYAIRTPSLTERLELTKRVRELLRQHEYLRAGDAGDHLDATLAELTVSTLYMEWGLKDLTGLRIDGQQATPASLINSGPEYLCEEILTDIRSQLELSRPEIKNS